MTTIFKFHSLFENDDADQGMAHLLTRAGMQEVCYELADIIVFNGGADIGTSIYGEQPIGGNIPYMPSKRDRMEIEIFDKYKGTDKLLLGICRGSQLLNCLNGGTLWQDVNNHYRDHFITDLASQKSYKATSTHHQMMRPNWSKAKVLAVANEATYKYADHDTWDNRHGVFFPDDHKDTEIVWYKETNTLCIQGHPEYTPNSDFADYCLELIRQYVNEVKLCVV